MSKTIQYITGIVIIAILVMTSIYIFTSNDEPKLTIYTYNSLLADPGFAYDRAFEVYAGLPSNSIKVVLLDDSAQIITRATTEKANPQADVLIGIDNANIGIARSNDILEAYEAKGLDALKDGLVEGLAPDHLLTPYDYGVISLWYLNNKFTGNINSTEFVLNDLLDQNIANQLVVENPSLSSPGLGFLLSTIAVFGDDETGVTGLIDGDWEQYWSDLSQNAGLVPSWGDALDLLYTDESSKSMMVSYTSSPAYGNCIWADNSSSALLSTEGGDYNGWQQIEGIGLVKNAPHKELAKEFIDWFISDELQTEIYKNQWMSPAKADITRPDCYDIVTPEEEINALNTQIPVQTLNDNLEDYLNRWELAWIS